MTFFTLNSIHCCKKSSFYFGSNNCQFLWNIIFFKSYRMNITYFQVTGTPLRPCDHCYGSILPEPEEAPPVPTGGGGGSRMLRGLTLRRRAVLGTSKCAKSVGRRGCASDPAGGAYSAPLGPLGGGEGLTCMKMHCYFLLNVKRGASQLYLGGLQLSSAGTRKNNFASVRNELYRRNHNKGSRMNVHCTVLTIFESTG